METTQKHFKKREAILSCLRQTREHPSAEWIYQQLKETYPSLSLGTVYRNLALFKEQGLITSLGTVNGVEHFDGDIHPHVHYICSRCGKIVDLDKFPVPRELSRTAAAYTGGNVESCQLTFTGICGACMKN